jgi:acyl-coenzyme A synthetase/AMP-(fatty) acid ligase
VVDDGWLNTGDTYDRDDGYFYYCGRSDDMLEVAGIWCSLFEIESTLIEHPHFAEAAVAGRADLGLDDVARPYDTADSIPSQ